MLRRTFRPEFLNRVDEVIVFHALTEDDLARIVDLLGAELDRRLAGHDLQLEVTPAAKSVIAREGTDPTYGARPLKADDPAPGREPAGAGRCCAASSSRGAHPAWTPTRSRAVAPLQPRAARRSSPSPATRRDARSGGEPGAAGAGRRSVLDLPSTVPPQADEGEDGERLD